MDGPTRKLTAQLDPNHPRPKSRPSSPAAFRPKARLNAADPALRRLNTRPNADRSPPTAPIAARPAPRANLSSLEPRQRALTTASAKLKIPHPEDRPRSGSLYHALSLSDISAPSSPTLSRSSPLAEPLPRANTPPALPSIKIRSKVTGLVKAASSEPSRSLSPPYATTRPIHPRARAPSITSSFSLNDPPSSPFYPITTASPAANPHRYAPLRAPSPARSYPPPLPSNDPNMTRKPPLAAKVDPMSVPLPPHSPPISALSLSSKSSLSRISPSLVMDQQTTDSHAFRLEQTTPFPSQPARKRRDRSRSKETSPHDPLHQGESDAESDGPERQLRAEAKTNRKIADLEITNRSLLAINASLETTKNRQAKEIRDLRRKLRESRLILPPRTFNVVKSMSEDERDNGDEDEDEDDNSDLEQGVDDAFQRVKALIDGLVESGKRALEARPEDSRVGLATRVLNADELRSWRESGQRTLTRDSHDAEDRTIQRLLSPATITVPDSDTSSESGQELSQGSSGPPPTLTITHSL